MLIDLARNDIGRIARIGSVKVTQAFVVERYSHVMHIVSNVEGMLRSDVGQLDVLKATFPAGTLTGAPKVRAMELIDELEPVQRGIYGGACGYLSFAGDMDLAIAIRTGIIKTGTLYVQAAGVVADSIPEMEWRDRAQGACTAARCRTGGRGFPQNMPHDRQLRQLHLQPGLQARASEGAVSPLFCVSVALFFSRGNSSADDRSTSVSWRRRQGRAQ